MKSGNHEHILFLKKLFARVLSYRARAKILCTTVADQQVGPVVTPYLAGCWPAKYSMANPCPLEAF